MELASTEKKTLPLPKYLATGPGIFQGTVATYSMNQIHRKGIRSPTHTLHFASLIWGMRSNEMVCIQMIV